MPLHFLWGDEDYLIDNSIAKLKNNILKGDINEFNYKSVDSPSFATFCELVKTNAMMFGDVVIVIKCQDYFISTKNKKELDEKQVKELVSALQNISEKVHLILVCKTPRGEKKKPDSRKKLYKELVKIANVEEFPSFREYEVNKIAPILKKMASEINIEIGNEEINYLIQTTGASLRDLSNQLEKLKIFAYPETKITTNMIDKIATSNTDIFSVVDFILEKNYTSALNLISEVLQKEHYLPCLMLLQKTITNLLITKIYSNSLSTFDIGIKTGQHEFLVRKNLEKIKNVSLRELARLKINLAEIDYKLKTGNLQEPICAFELAFVSDKIGEN